MENMTIWNAVKQVPPQFLKEIQAGRLKGKSDINPQWRYQVMTEQFGLCGIGWKWELKRTWTEPTPDGQIPVFAEVAIYTKPTPQSPWSDPIPGIGGSMLIEQERAGLHVNDEGYKMAITDAIGTGLKFLGVAADVYAGLWDGSKYRETKEPEKPAVCTAQPAPKAEPVKESVPPKTEVKAALEHLENQPPNIVTQEQLKTIAALRNAKWNYSAACVQAGYGQMYVTKLTTEQADYLIGQAAKEGFTL